MRTLIRGRSSEGFSLIEVLIAVVILATGLLALAVLQSSLTRNSADTKARSRIGGLVSGRLDQVRASGYGGIPASTGGTTVTILPVCSPTPNDVCDVQNQAGVSNLQLTQLSTQFHGVDAGANFVAGAVGANEAEYKRVVLTATWTDASGTSRNLSMTTLLSPLSLSGASTLINLGLAGSSAAKPIVRQANPTSAGMIPIAIGNNTDTAATNPKPETGGASANQTLPSTTFTVLTYRNENSTDSTIQKRFETTLVECTCKNGNISEIPANPSNLRTISYRPTFWDATRYTVPEDAKRTPTSGPFTSSGAVKQSDLCTECCRDHRDSASDTVKFNPFSADYNKYQATVTVTKVKGKDVATVSLPRSGSPSSLIVAGSSDTYIDACRLIRTDGVWRVAADYNAEHMGLLPTQPLGEATNSQPTVAGAAAYEEFVIDYLGSRITNLLANLTAPLAETFFESHGLNNPDLIPAKVNDKRYLNSRNLYLDFLEKPALDKIKSVNSSCAAADKPGCLLPYLPFNTINVTDLANWTQSNATIIGVTNGSGSVGDPLNPVRGAVTGKAAGTANAQVTMGRSNSAIASSYLISPFEELAANNLADAQPFRISGGATTSTFFTSITGLGQTSDLSTNNDPLVAWKLGGDTSDCSADLSRTDTDPNPYRCVVTSALSLPMTLIFSGYNLKELRTEANPCDANANNVQRPYLVCNTVASVSGVTGLLFSNSVTGSKTAGEQSTLTLTGSTLPANSTVIVDFDPNGEAAASFSCDATTNQPVFTAPTSCP